MRFKLSFIVLVFVLWSCSAGTLNSPIPARIVIDGLGRSVNLPARIDRAISLAPSVTEMIFASGAGDRLVGVTTYCNFPEEALNVPKVGDTQTPNIETIIALKPQVVFVSTDSQLQSFADTLAQQDVAVYVLSVKNFDDVSANIRQLGSIFGTEERADAMADDLQKRVRNVEAHITEPAVRTFIQISREPLFTVGNDSFVTGVVERAGGISVTKYVQSAYPKLNKETALALKPDVIILTDSEDNRTPNDALRNSPAVKNGRVYGINADIISRPGPRLVDAVEQIARFLHGSR